MRRIIEKIIVIVTIFIFSTTLALKKSLGHILMRIVPSPKNTASIHVGGNTIETLPSRNLWWKSMYIGYCGVEIVQKIRQFLGKSGIFIDVGAGVGYFSAIESEIVGDSGQVHCFEPYPPNISSIQKMIMSKPNSNIVLNACVLGIDDAICSYYIDKFENYTSGSMAEDFINLENYF